MSENELIVQAETARLERAKIEERLAISADLAGVKMGPDGLVCEDGRALRRMAIFFAGSTIWPEDFQGKPENCFVCLTMAARLKIDPTLLAQNLYEHKGKWGMQSKLTTALANVSGKFKGEIWHTWSADGKLFDSWDDARTAGDSLRCTAHARMRSTGEEVTLSLSRAEARAWGWYEPKGDKRLPSKWVQMEEGMFLYRTSDWLIRHYAPEVTMGLLSADEIDDMDGHAPEPPKKPSPKKHALPAPAAEPPKSIEAPKPADASPSTVAAHEALEIHRKIIAAIDLCQTRDEIRAVHTGVRAEFWAMLGPDLGSKIRNRCLSREKEISCGTTPSQPPETGNEPKVAQDPPKNSTANQAASTLEQSAKPKRGRPRKATDAEIAAEQASHQAKQDADFVAPPENSEDSTVNEEAEPPGPLDEAREFLPEQWSNREVDACIENIVNRFPAMSESEKKELEVLAAQRKKRLAT